MKVALCLAGEYRTFDTELVQHSLLNLLIKRYDCDVFISTWDRRGVSYSHGHVFEKTQRFKDDIITENSLYNKLEIKSFEIENFESWKNNLPAAHQQFMQMCGVHHRGCLPQLYKKQRVVELTKNTNEKYDYIIVTRPDIFLWDKIILDNFKTQKTIYTFNLQNSLSFHPSRVYDIFYMGETEAVTMLAKAYENILHLLDDPFNSGLQSVDCCKMLYVHAKKFCNLNVNTVDSIAGEVFRGDLVAELDHYSKLCKRANQLCFDKQQLLRELNLTV
jgi:hypothetical protein